MCLNTEAEVAFRSLAEEFGENGSRIVHHITEGVAEGVALLNLTTRVCVILIELIMPST